MKQRKHFISKGFALPTVLIASVVLIAVLATAVASATSSRTSLQTQQYTQLARDAAESGVAMAEACIAAGTTSWANPLRPGGTCAGLATQCTTSACYVMQSSTARTTFTATTPSVAGNATTVAVTGTVELLRASNGQVWRTYRQVIQKQDVVASSGTAVRWKQVANGTSHSCGLTTNGAVYCWGLNSYGQLGDASTTTRSAPTPIAQGAIPAGSKIIQIVIGTLHTCAIASDTKAYCWGSNANGRLGDNTTTDRSSPVAVAQGAIPAGLTIRQLSAGGSFTCAIATDYKPYCWGDNTNGQLGDNTTTQRLTPVAVLQGAMPATIVMQITTGTSHTCAIGADSKPYCWGLNGSGRLGDNTTTQRLTPVAVLQGAMPAGIIVVQVFAAGSHTCALPSDGRVYCWGLNTSSQLGDGSTTSRSTAVAVSPGAVPLTTFSKQISGGESHTCLLTTNYLTYCWGLNTNGQLGDGSTSTRSTPVAVAQGALPSGELIRSVSSGDNFNCEISNTSTMYCFGLNANGQLGNGSTTQSTSRVVVASFVDTATLPALGASIAVGNSHGCSVGTDDSLYCFGLNANGQLGNNSTTQSTTPVATSQGALPAGLKIRQVANGQSHSCVLASDGEVYCWGLNTNGQLGDGSTTQSTTPVAVAQGAIPATSVIIQITAGASHTCAIASDSKAYCWGLNTNGQLGNNSTTQSTTPVAVSLGALPTGGVVRQISAGSSHTCATASNYRPYCWGNNANGQLGNNSTTQANTAVAVSQGAMPIGGYAQQVSAGVSQSCAISADSKAYCWGLNTNGQLGNNSTTQSLIPVAVSLGAMPTGGMVQQLSAGTSFMCSIASDSKAYCWGLNTNGQLGNNSTTQSLIPVAVSLGAMPAGTLVQQTGSGTSHSCALSTISKTYCWGLNTNGQLGNNSTAQSLIPVAVSNAPSYTLPPNGNYYFR